MKWVELVARTGDIKTVYKIVSGIPADGRPFWRKIHRWEDNIKTMLKDVVCVW
jgi:hypothetical protein